MPMSTQLEIIDQFKGGQSATDLACSHGLTRAIVYGLLRRNGLKPMDNYKSSRKLKGDVDVIVSAYKGLYSAG